MKTFAAFISPLNAPGVYSNSMNGGLQLGLRANDVWEPSHEMLERAQALIDCSPSMHAPLFAIGLPDGSSYHYEVLGGSAGVQGPPMNAGLQRDIRRCLERWLSRITADTVLQRACIRCKVFPQHITNQNMPTLMRALEQSARLYLGKNKLRAMLEELRALGGDVPADRRVGQLVSIEITDEDKIDTARSTSTELSKDAGLTNVESVKVATVVSELARNIIKYADSGTIKFRVISNGIEVIAKDAGPGIPHLDDVLEGRWRSKTGMGLGILGSKRLMTTFEVQTTIGLGTTVTATMLRA